MNSGGGLFHTAKLTALLPCVPRTAPADVTAVAQQWPVPEMPNVVSLSAGKTSIDGQDMDELPSGLTVPFQLDLGCWQRTHGKSRCSTEQEAQC